MCVFCKRSQGILHDNKHDRHYIHMSYIYIFIFYSIYQQVYQIFFFKKHFKGCLTYIIGNIYWLKIEFYFFFFLSFDLLYITFIFRHRRKVYYWFYIGSCQFGKQQEKNVKNSFGPMFFVLCTQTSFFLCVVMCKCTVNCIIYMFYIYIYLWYKCKLLFVCIYI